MNKRSAPALLLVISVLACSDRPPDAAIDTPSPVSGLLPIDPPLASHPVLPAMPADCDSTPELAPTWKAPERSTVPIGTVLDRARQDPGGLRGNERWFEKAPTDTTLVTLRDGRAMWLIGYAEPPPFPQLGPGPMFGSRSRWTAWIALFDAKTGDYVTALSCGRVATGGDGSEARSLIAASATVTPLIGPAARCEALRNGRLAGDQVQLVAVYESTALEIALWQESGMGNSGSRAGPGMSPVRSRPAREIIVSCYFDGVFTYRGHLPAGGKPPVFERMQFLFDGAGNLFQERGGTRALLPLVRPAP